MKKSQIRSLAKSLARSANGCLFRLGDVLGMIHRNEFYRDWGWHSWTDYVEDEVGISISTAYELMHVARWAAQYQLTVSQRKKLSALGRTKVAALTKLARKDNLDQWFSYAASASCGRLKALSKGRMYFLSPKTVSVWMHRENLSSYEEALTLARSDYGDMAQGELLGAVCDYYVAAIKQRKKRAKRKSAGKRK
jgi:hypothetical protein